MPKTKRNRYLLGIFLACLPFLLVGLGFLLREPIHQLLFLFVTFIPNCFFHTITGYYCPGCGITRSVLALLRFDLLSSLKANPAALSFAVYGGICYLSYLLRLFGKKTPLIKHKLFWLWVVLGIWLIFSILRNFIPELAPMGTALEGLQG